MHFGGSYRMKIYLGLLLVGFTFLISATAQAEEHSYSAGLGFEFASGRYGTGVRTESIYAPFTAAFYPTDRLGFSLEIPYVYQSSSAVNTGVYRGATGGMMHAQQRSQSMSGSMGNGMISSSAGADSQGAHDGLGDITAKAGYVVVPEGDLMPKLRPYLTVKFPTGDSSRGLGTGAFDEGVAVELSKWLGNWYSFAEAGYVFQGRSSILPVRDYVSYDAGGGYLVREKFLPMLIVKGATPPVQGSSDLLEVRLKMKYQLTQTMFLEGYLSKGMTANSPDYGSGLAVSYDF
jgi:hypothetical protein